MSKLPYKVIGTYRPAEGATPADIGHDLVAMLAKTEFKPADHKAWPGATWCNQDGAEVRNGPGSAGDGTQQWHHDCNASDDLYIAVWANVNPTELRHKYGRKIYQAQPFELIVFPNTLKHRRPTESLGRIFFRQYVELPSL